MEPKTPITRFLREIWPPLILCVGVLVIVIGIQLIGDSIVSQTLTEALIRMIVVVALFMAIVGLLVWFSGGEAPVESIDYWIY